MEKFELHILGCGSALPTTRHFPTSQIVNVRDKLFMIDCGEAVSYTHLDVYKRQLVDKLSKVRRSGLTFAPEAGTQRMRDAVSYTHLLCALEWGGQLCVYELVGQRSVCAGRQLQEMCIRDRLRSARRGGRHHPERALCSFPYGGLIDE